MEKKRILTGPIRNQQDPLFPYSEYSYYILSAYVHKKFVLISQMTTQVTLVDATHLTLD